MEKKLFLNLIWHMHQPYYFNETRDIFTFPWVRTHATKDYLYMAKLADRFPQVKMTFNFTPSLLAQIELYLQGKTDEIWLHFEKKAEDLNEKEKIFISRNFFHAPSKVQTNHFPRFEELKIKANQNIQFFSVQDWLDLQILYQLLWFDPITIKNQSDLKQLIQRGKGYIEDDKKIIYRVVQQSLNEIIPLYKKLDEREQIEISTSPFYHPIIPLLIDNWVARESTPKIKLPTHRFQFKDDADAQIQMAKEYSEQIWGTQICGIWPSEGSISTATVHSFADHGFSWTATGEEVLFRTLGISAERDQEGLLFEGKKLYQPWIFHKSGKEIGIFFRDRHLSDLIGFAYQHLSPEEAVQDLIGRLEKIAQTLPIGHNSIVSIVLDGENAWEYYDNNGFEFLYGLYKFLEGHPYIETITPSQYLCKQSRHPTLDQLTPGSWIYGLLNTWIGHEEKNWAWDQLFLVRDLLEKRAKGLDLERKKQVFNILYQAEGSDWFWWLGPDNHTDQKEEFRNQFVALLKRACDLIGEKYPGEA